LSDPPRPKPPPLPARARRAPSKALSDSEKSELALNAFGLMNEQLQARIVHYRADLATSPELDAVTAQVVAQLKLMQSKLGVRADARPSLDELERRQASTLHTLLARLLSPDSQFAPRVLAPVGRRVARLFFESELHERTKGDKGRTIHIPEQGVYYVLQRFGRRISAELEGFEYASEEVKAASFALFSKIQHDLKVAFLSRRSPELNSVMSIYSSVLTEFLQEHLPPRLEQMASSTVRAARTAHHPNSMAYKLPAEVFPEFRREWERAFVEQMVFFCGDALLSEIERTGGDFREETVKFFTDPHMFSDASEVLCEEIYEFLCLEGFVDLPLEFRGARERRG
jgi:hypothetical protein